MRNFDFYRPATTAEALKTLSEADGARAKGGGTDLLGLMKEHLVEPKAVVQLSGMAELRGIALDAKGALRIGAAMTLTEVAEHELVQRTGYALAYAAGETATPLIRNRATLGGNLCQRPRCWYFRHPDYPCAKKGGETCFAQLGENKYHAIFDNQPCAIVHPSNTAPALIALDATIHVQSVKGTRDIAAKDFWIRDPEDLSKETVLAEGELVTAVSYTPRPGGSAYVEVKEKQSYDWALASAAAFVSLDGDKIADLRIVLQHLAPTPLLREAAAAVVRGKRLTEELALEAGAAAAEGARPLRDNRYKIALVKAVVADALMEAYRRAKEAR